MKRHKKIIICTESLITAECVIPAKAGIQENTGFPRIKCGKSSVNPGMLNRLRFISSFVVLIFAIIFISIGITLMGPIIANGQSKGRMVLFQEAGRDPFLLPSGVHPLSKTDTRMGTKGFPSTLAGNPSEVLSSPLKVKAILISERIRLALIDRHIVTIGDSVQHEKVLEIKTDRVLLGKGDQKRTLLLSQSPVLLTIEDNPPTLILPHRGGGKEGGKGEKR